MHCRCGSGTRPLCRLGRLRNCPYPPMPGTWPAQGRFEECISDCDAAVDKGREHRADFKLVARALTRKANALVKLNRWAASATGFLGVG